MERKIEFKAKRKDTGEWIESKSIYQATYSGTFLRVGAYWVEVIPETVSLKGGAAK